MRDEARHGRDFLLGALAGAALMYLFDPAGGGRRRALARDQVVHAGHELEHLGSAAAARGRDLRNRARGLVAGVRGKLRTEIVDDDILLARVRARLGHRASHPGAIQVVAQGGTVTLSGPVAAEEAEGLLTTVASVPGVRDLVDRLDVRTAAGPEPGA